MFYYEVAPNKIVRSGSDWFTYASDARLAIGQVVTIPVGSQSLVGVVLREVEQPTYATKPISSCVLDAILPEQLVATICWMNQYYATPLATVLQTALPRGITKSRRERSVSTSETIRNRTHFLLNKAQSDAVETFTHMSPGTGILHGVTGSGKTAIYIELAQRMHAQQKSVIVLVPEISLTPQLVDEFRHHFDNVVVTHSRQTEAERHLAWKTVAASTTPQIVIGPRSALFMPVHELGLIVIDEAHEPSYKQEQSPRYSALRVASILASHWHARVVQGSATPLVAEYYIAQHSQRPIVTISERAQQSARKPLLDVIDMTQKASRGTDRIFSRPFLRSLDEALNNGQQVLLFHNRRGSASVTLCESCGWSAMCLRCFIPYTLHADLHMLRCHVCGASERVPTSCPDCGGTEIIFKGIGTKLLESELHRRYPEKTIARFDGDATNDGSVESRYQELYSGAIDIIIGTQVIAKGLDLPHLRMVGIPQADAGLSLPDFSSSERTFQLLSQAIGRVGRSDHETRVVVQTFQPDHPAIQHGLVQDYEGFYHHTLQERRQGHFPPYSYLLKLTCVYKTEATAAKHARLVATHIKSTYPDVRVLGPTPSFYERQRDTFRWQVVVRSASRQLLVAIMRELPPTHWRAELDPLGLL